jgi:hypothetical protein
VEGTRAIKVAVDNDVALKAACYGLILKFWGGNEEERGVGVLGSARYVLAHVLERTGRVEDTASTSQALDEFFAWATVLEPSDEEAEDAAELERLAQRVGVELDVGESQLAAIVVARGIPLLDTGDKRAICGLDALARQSTTCEQLCTRVRCLEQLLLRALDNYPEELEGIKRAVCDEPNVDKSASICFGCFSGESATHDDVFARLQSYVDKLRRQAPGVLAAR